MRVIVLSKILFPSKFIPKKFGSVKFEYYKPISIEIFCV